MSKNPLKQKMKGIDSARQMYNTLRQLTIQRAVNMLEEGERGIYTRLAWTSRKIEKRWSVMIGLKRNREGSLLEMDWDLRPTPEDQLPPGATAAQAEAQAVALRAAYEQIENLRELRGSLTGATEIDPATVIMREVEDPLVEVALVAYVYEMLGRKDWAGFVEVFGIPDLFFVMPQGTSTDDLNTWQSVVEQMFGDGKGLLPNGSDIKTAGGDVRGSNPFKEFVKFQREDVVLAGTGGKLTMLAESGSGTLAGGAQAEVFERIAQAEARDITEIFNKAIDRPLLEEKFAGQPVLAQFVIAAEDEEDTKAFAETVSKLAAGGYFVDPDQVQEKTGLRVAFREPQSEVGGQRSEVRNRSFLKPWTWFGNRPSAISNRQLSADKVQDKLLENARTALATAVESDLIEVYDRLAEIIDNTPDDELVAALENFQTLELPELAAEALADPAAADAIADTLSAGLLNGVAAATEDRRRKTEDRRRRTASET